MILRRLSQSLKEQNWTAILIEFVLLVAGVFLGIQVANWNEAQHERQSEQQYIERLRQELTDIMPDARLAQTILAKDVDRLEAVRTYFASGQGGDVLNAEHCAAIAKSHIYAMSIYYPPTIKELISTGRILVIRNPKVRSAIMSFDQTHAAISQLRTDVQIDRRPLARYYPELIALGAAADWSTLRCDFPAMRGSPAFLNDFTDNSFRFQAFSAMIGKHQADTLAALAKALDAGATVPARQDGNQKADGSQEAAK